MIVCLDLEGVLVPEIWMQFSRKTGIKELRLTTRDIPDYEALMTRRIKLLKAHGLRLKDIQNVIAKMRPLPGALSFLETLRSRRQVIILSDTFYEFAWPLMRRLHYPLLFCNSLAVDQKGFIRGWRLRQKDGKAKAVTALRKIGFEVVAAGDSYNDLTMLKRADRGVLFNPPESIAKAYPRFPVARTYSALLSILTSC